MGDPLYLFFFLKQKKSEWVGCVSGCTLFSRDIGPLLFSLSLFYIFLHNNMIYFIYVVCVMRCCVCGLLLSLHCSSVSSFKTSLLFAVEWVLICGWWKDGLKTGPFFFNFDYVKYCLAPLLYFIWVPYKGPLYFIGCDVYSAKVWQVDDQIPTVIPPSNAPLLHWGCVCCCCWKKRTVF